VSAWHSHVAWDISCLLIVVLNASCWNFALVTMALVWGCIHAELHWFWSILISDVNFFLFCENLLPTFQALICAVFICSCHWFLSSYFFSFIFLFHYHNQPIYLAWQYVGHCMKSFLLCSGVSSIYAVFICSCHWFLSSYFFIFLFHYHNQPNGTMFMCIMSKHRVTLSCVLIAQQVVLIYSCRLVSVSSLLSFLSEIINQVQRFLRCI